MMLCTWVLSLLLLILPACLHKQQARVLEPEKAIISRCEKSAVQEKSELKSATAEECADLRLKALSLEAKCGDIPVPLGSEPLYDFFKQSPADGKSIVFGYTNKTAVPKLYNYFKTEFMRLGWSFMGGIQDVESMLTFEKPDRVCSISLRPLNGSNALIMMVYPKDDREDLEYC